MGFNAFLFLHVTSVMPDSIKHNCEFPKKICISHQAHTTLIKKIAFIINNFSNFIRLYATASLVSASRWKYKYILEEKKITTFNYKI